MSTRAKINNRVKITAGGAALVAGAGLALLLLIGNAGATTPAHSPDTTPGGVVVTKSVDVGATTFTPDPNAPRPTATITASASPAAVSGRKPLQANDPKVQTVSVAPGVTIPVEPGEAPTSTVFATTPAAPAGR